jgi:hypothetical protein
MEKEDIVDDVEGTGNDAVKKVSTVLYCSAVCYTALHY